MNNSANLPKHIDHQLLEKFNGRETDAFALVYSCLYRKLHYFVSRILHDSGLSPDDLIQDVFVRIWEKRDYRFDTPENLENFIYISIRNTLRNHTSRQSRLARYRDAVAGGKSLSFEVAETEIVAFLSEAADMLPAECAKVFRMHVEGWDVKEIALVLGKAESTVYKQQQKSVSILRKKLKDDSLLLLLILFS